jgi:hypothetical protein
MVKRQSICYDLNTILRKVLNQVVVDVDVDWRGFGGRDLIPTHRKIS